MQTRMSVSCFGAGIWEFLNSFPSRAGAQSAMHEADLCPIPSFINLAQFFPGPNAYLVLERSHLVPRTPHAHFPSMSSSAYSPLVFHEFFSNQRRMNAPYDSLRPAPWFTPGCPTSHGCWQEDSVPCLLSQELPACLRRHGGLAELSSHVPQSQDSVTL